MITDVLQLLKSLPSDPCWTVLVCPDSSKAECLGVSLGVLFSGGGRFSGRTVCVGDRKVSAVAASDPVFIPSSTPFNLVYIGWGIKMMVEAEEWRNKATKVLRTDR